MARYRLLSAHYLPDDKYLLGDKETEHIREEGGAVVGDGTPHRVDWPTLEMEPLDDEARAMLDKERERLEKAHTSMNPIEALALQYNPMLMDKYEEDYIPGTGQRRRPMKAHGS